MLLVFRSCSTHGNRVSESLAQIGVSLMGEILERLLVGGNFEKDFSPCYICTVHDGVRTHASECTSTQKSEIKSEDEGNVNSRVLPSSLWEATG